MIVEGPGNFVYLRFENGLEEAAHVYIVCVFGLTFGNVFMEHMHWKLNQIMMMRLYTFMS